MAQQMRFETVSGFRPDRLGQTEFAVPALGVLDEFGAEQAEERAGVLGGDELERATHEPATDDGPVDLLCVRYIGEGGRGRAGSDGVRGTAPGLRLESPRPAYDVGHPSGAGLVHRTREAVGLHSGRQ